MTIEERASEAISRIRPLLWRDGPNFWTVDVEGWGISAPSKAELELMICDWFEESAQGEGAER